MEDNSLDDCIESQETININKFKIQYSSNRFEGFLVGLPIDEIKKEDILKAYIVFYESVISKLPGRTITNGCPNDVPSNYVK